MGIDPVTAQLGLAGVSYFTGKKDRDKANQAQDAYAQQLRDIVAQAEAAYGPAATEAAISKAMDDIAREYQNASMASERNLYARGMGERTLGANEHLRDEEARAKLAARQYYETTNPEKLMAAKAGTLGAMGGYADSMAANASAATALPWQLYGAYQGATREDALTEYLKNAIKQGQSPAYVPQNPMSTMVGGFGTGWGSMATSNTDESPWYKK